MSKVAFQNNPNAVSGVGTTETLKYQFLFDLSPFSANLTLALGLFTSASGGASSQLGAVRAYVGGTIDALDGTLVASDLAIPHGSEISNQNPHGLTSAPFANPGGLKMVQVSIQGPSGGDWTMGAGGVTAFVKDDGDAKAALLSLLVVNQAGLLDGVSLGCSTSETLHQEWEIGDAMIPGAGSTMTVDIIGHTDSAAPTTWRLYYDDTYQATPSASAPSGTLQGTFGVVSASGFFKQTVVIPRPGAGAILKLSSQTSAGSANATFVSLSIASLLDAPATRPIPEPIATPLDLVDDCSNKEIALNSNVTAEGLGRLIEQYKHKPRLAALLASYLDEFQDIENANYGLLTLRTLDDAVGAQQDIIGKIVGRARNGLSDDDYRTVLRAQIVANNSRGNPEDLIKILVLVGGTDSTPVVLYRPRPPASVQIELMNNIGTLNPALAFELLDEARGEAIALTFLWSYSDDADQFALSDANAPATSSTRGLGSTVSGTTGGHLTSVRSNF